MRFSTAVVLVMTAAAAALNVALYSHNTDNYVALGLATFVGLMFVVNLTVYIVRGE